MLLADVYRLLEPQELILAGDQFKMFDLSDDLWAPVDRFVGHRVRDVAERAGRVQFRRLIVHEVQT